MHMDLVEIITNVCHVIKSQFRMQQTYCKTSNIRLALIGNKIVDHSDICGASPLGAAPTTSSFSLSIWLQGIRQRQPQDSSLLSALLQLHLHSRLTSGFNGIRQRQPQDSREYFKCWDLVVLYYRLDDNHELMVRPINGRRCIDAYSALWELIP